MVLYARQADGLPVNQPKPKKRRGHTSVQIDMTGGQHKRVAELRHFYNVKSTVQLFWLLVDMAEAEMQTLKEAVADGIGDVGGEAAPITESPPETEERAPPQD